MVRPRELFLRRGAPGETPASLSILVRQHDGDPKLAVLEAGAPLRLVHATGDQEAFVHGEVRFGRDGQGRAGSAGYGCMVPG